MASVSRAFLDGMAKFATGLRRWSEWRSWFNARAGRLVRLLDRPRFEQLMHDPKEAGVTLLREKGVMICDATPELPDQSENPVSSESMKFTRRCAGSWTCFFN